MHTVFTSLSISFLSLVTVLLQPAQLFFSFFFFNDTATTEIYTLSLHDALPIYVSTRGSVELIRRAKEQGINVTAEATPHRSEEHTSELQSQSNLVCRLLLEKKKKIKITKHSQRD